MIELIQIFWNLLMLREAKRRGEVKWQIWAFAIGFVVLLYAIGLPAAVLYQNHPQYQNLFIAAMVLDGIVAVAGFVWAWRLWWTLLAKKKSVFGNDEILRSGKATQDEAIALANALKSHGYFCDRGVTVLLDKGTGYAAISFVVTDGAWDKPGLVCWFEDIAKEVAPAVGGLPVQLHLLDTSRYVKKSLTVE